MVDWEKMLYKNKEWLYKKYWNEELSICRIAKLCGVSYTTIYKWLKRYNIPRRHHSEAIHLSTANHCNLSQKAIEWINGELLGDGHLRSRSSYSASFGYSSKYEEYIEYISNTLKSFGIKQTGRIRRRIDKRHNNIIYHYVSRDYIELLPIRKKWYPKGKKMIPIDVRLTPLTLRQHYIGDGSLNHQKHGNPRIILATNGFKISEVKRLIKQLLRLGFKASRRPSRNTIGISNKFTKDFLDYIGKCPVSCYQYKFLY